MNFLSSYDEIYLQDMFGNHIAYVKFINVGGNKYVITETHVDPSLAGQEIDSALVSKAVKEIKGRGASVDATCPFAKAWLIKNERLV